MTQRRLRRAILVLFHLMFLIIPFFFTWVNEELFEFPKMLLTYGLTLLIAGLWLARMIAAKKIIWVQTVFDWPLLAFLASQLLATIFSIHPRTSVFGYYTRFHGGLLSTLTYLTLFYAFVSNVKKKELAKFWPTIFMAVLGISLYGILEHFGHSLSCLLITGQFDVACWVQKVQHRVFASFGQPNWLAAYLVTLLPINLISVEQTKKNWLKIVFTCSAFASLMALIYTQSRSGLLGFFVSFVILVLGRIWLRKRNLRNLKLKVSIFHGLILSFATIILLLGTNLTPSARELFSARGLFSKQTPPPPTTTETETQVTNRLEVGGTDSGEIRKIVWTGALKIWQRHPIFGSGVATFAYSYYQDRPVAHNLVSEWDFLYNKAHNEFLNFLATTGLVGFLAYSSILIVAGLVVIKEIFYAKKNQSSLKDLKDKEELLALLSGLIALSISNFFGFSTVMVSILLFIFLGMIVVICQDPVSKVKVGSKLGLGQKLSLWQKLSLGLVLILNLILLNKVRQIYVADKAFASGQSYLQAGYAQQGLEKLQTAIELRPREALFHDKLANAYSKLAITFAQQEATDSAERFKEGALQEVKITQSLNPRHLNFYKSHARILILLSQLEPALLNEAQEVLKAGIKLAPTDAKLVYNLGLIQLEQGQIETGKESLEKALKLKPNYLKVQEKLKELNLRTELKN